MENFDLQSLPEACLSNILLYTSPVDASRLSLVSHTFLDAGNSDVVWENFLPSDYRDILSRSVSPVDFLTKKELYFRLCSSILIDDGNKSFELVRSTGKKCFMLSSRELCIIWGSTPRYWNWRFIPESRFPEVAVLRNVCWLEINGRINSQILSPRTTYGAYLIVKYTTDFYGLKAVARASLKLGSHESEQVVLLRPALPNHDNYPIPTERSDHWFEIDLGEFFTDNDEDGEVEISLKQLGGHWKRGLIIQGMEIRPRE